MIYCINPTCISRKNPEGLKHCQNCATPLRINNRYELIKPLHDFDEPCHAEVFEVVDWDFNAENWEQPKVLKILKNDSKEAVELFKREGKVLAFLSMMYPGFPKVESDGYFTFSPKKCQKPLHCLIMEKIPGLNLGQWVQQNGVICEYRAQKWLEQLMDILTQVHELGLCHRDIKPGNLMVKEAGELGQLVLIDFGSVGVKPPFLTQIGGTTGYSAPELDDGKAVFPQSDFFSVGRTFVYLLTGKHPRTLRKHRQTRQLIWRDSAPLISEPFADLIDELMALLPEDRPKNTRVILQRLRSLREDQPPRLLVWQGLLRHVFLRWRGFPVVLLASLVVTYLVIEARSQGFLQIPELKTSDGWMQVQPALELNPNILIVAVNDDDIKLFGKPLSDKTVYSTLKKVEKYSPQVIGLDIYRDTPQGSGWDELVKYLHSSDRVIALCKVGEVIKALPAPYPGISPPPGIPQQRLGFSDSLLPDSDKTIRRYILGMKLRPESPCGTTDSFSFQVVRHYLQVVRHYLPIKIQYQNNGGQNFWIGPAKAETLKQNAGGDALGVEVPIKFSSSQRVAQEISLQNLLEAPDADLRQLIQDRIVLIGYVNTKSKDYHLTPVGKMHGVRIHAHVISQILDLVSGKHPLLLYWPKSIESIWIWVWSLVAGIISFKFRYARNIIVPLGVILVVLGFACLSFYTQKFLVPFIAPALGLITTSILVVYIMRRIR